MITCTRRLQFCAAHRVVGHENKCRNLHGHNYVVLVTAAGAIDAIGRIVDFSVLKDRVGGWIDRFWDHGCIFWEEDHASLAAVNAFGNTKTYSLPANPTAENLADYLLTYVCPEVLAGTNVEAIKVVVWETENCYAEAVSRQ